MNDDLEQRLHRLGNQPSTALDAATLAAMEARVMSTIAPRRRVLMPILAAAAALLLVAGTVFAFRDDRRDSLQPGDTAPFVTNTASTVTSSVTSTTVAGPPTTTTAVTSAPSTALTVPTSASSPGVTVVPVTAPTVASTVAATTPSTTPPTTSPPSASTAPTTAAPAPSQPVPAASFALNVRRVDGQLRFNWPRYEGPGGQRYVLLRVGPGGLTEWPPAPARIAATVNRIGITFTSLDLPTTEPRRWVLAVVGADRELLAVSSPITSF